MLVPRLGAMLAVLLLPAGAAASFADHEDPVLRALWSEGLALERQEQLLESSRRYEVIAGRVPDSALIRWRISRNYWRYGERLPLDDKTGRMQSFQLAERWADAALDLDAECGECMLWKLAALGRIATTGGVFRAAHTAPKIAELIERGIALRPTHRDGPQNVTLANLYYAGSAFYRVVPDWRWLPLVIGVRGDNHRALEYIREAIAIADSRLDYQVELGAVLLCIGRDEDDPERIAQGRAVLEQAMALQDFQSTDQFDRAHAEILAAQPERACGYSRDGWIELDAARRPRTAGIP
jgi:tetratricopeptide (TPR) repeat protein